MEYLTEEDLKTANHEVIKESGGANGAVNEANLHHVCDRVKTHGKNVIEKASFYLFYLAFQAHAFTDGNKRTSIAACVAFLEKNGHLLDATDEELIGMALLVASGNFSLKQTQDWLKERVKNKQKDKKRD